MRTLSGEILYLSINESVDPAAEIKRLVPMIVKSVQEEYDAWVQDEDGYDEELGCGGICDRVADRISDILSGDGFDTDIGGQDGDDHAWAVATKDGKMFGVDVPRGTYETGSGYCWKKIPNVVFDESDIVIWKETL